MTKPHDATLYANPARSTPAETAAAHQVYVEGVQDSYRSSAEATAEQYRELAGHHAVAPTLTSLSPNTAVVGGANFTIRVLGTGFNEDTTIWWGDHAEPTTLVSPTEVTTGVIPSSIGGPATIQVSVINGFVESNALPFTFTGAKEEPELVPDTTWLKADIIGWLLDNGVDLDEPALTNLTKSELLSLAQDILSPPE